MLCIVNFVDCVLHVLILLFTKHSDSLVCCVVHYDYTEKSTVTQTSCFLTEKYFCIRECFQEVREVQPLCLLDVSPPSCYHPINPSKEQKGSFRRQINRDRPGTTSFQPLISCEIELSGQASPEQDSKSLCLPAALYIHGLTIFFSGITIKKRREKNPQGGN